MRKRHSYLTKESAMKLVDELRGESFVWAAKREVRKWLQVILRTIDVTVEEGWQDEDRTYTPAEQQLAVRFDCSCVRG